jgi:hypothetical protein
MLCAVEGGGNSQPPGGETNPSQTTVELPSSPVLGLVKDIIRLLEMPSSGLEYPSI